MAAHQYLHSLGASFYFKRDTASDGTIYPWANFGIIQEIAPNFSTTPLELRDPFRGLNQLVEQAITQFSEQYTLTLRSFSMWDLQHCYYGEPPENVSHTASEASTTHAARIGGLVAIVDSDGDAVNRPLSQVAGIYFGGDGVTTDADDITAIDIATKTITTTTDYSAVLSDGDLIIIHPTGLADPLNAGTYTVVGTPGTTTIVVAEDFGGAANESGVTVDLSHGQGSGDGTIMPPDEWSVDSLEDGFVRIATDATITGATVTTNANVTIVYGMKALSGYRLLRPQSAVGVIRGLGKMVLRGSNGAVKFQRNATWALLPQSQALPANEYGSWQLQATVISDLAATDVAGTMLQHVGTAADPS